MSITPLREALQRLAQQGLVVLDAQLGARVAGVSREDVEDVYQVRLLLEPPAVEQSVVRGGDRWLEELVAAMERLRETSRSLDGSSTTVDELVTKERLTAWGAAHRQFHMVLIDACGSAWLRQFIDVLHQHGERYCNLAQERDETMQSALELHERIFEAAVNADASAASTATADHLRVSIEILDEMF